MRRISRVRVTMVRVRVRRVGRVRVTFRVRVNRISRVRVTRLGLG